MVEVGSYRLRFVGKLLGVATGDLVDTPARMPEEHKRRYEVDRRRAASHKLETVELGHRIAKLAEVGQKQAQSEDGHLKQADDCEIGSEQLDTGPEQICDVHRGIPSCVSR